jgi:glycosyltransferase involved in cell wall biosynthesis
MPDVWLDVTTILGWQRPAVGIVRVESECAAFALENKKIRSRFCCFDAIACRYREVLPEEVCEALARIGTKRSANLVEDLSANSSATFIPPLASREQRLTVFVLRLLALLPQRWRGCAFNFAATRKTAYQAASRSYREARLAVREFLRPADSGRFNQEVSSEQPVAAPVHAVPFSGDDVYVSLGIDWNQKDLKYLFAQKRCVGFRVLLFCYDIIPVKFPHLCVADVAAKFAEYFTDLAWCADRICCISGCSRRDLTHLLDDLGAPIPQMEVVKLGCEIMSSDLDESAPDVSELLGSKYVLFVSTIERRKNHETIYRAYTRLIDSGVSELPLLVFIGMPGWGVRDLMADLRLDPRIQPYIRILNQVTDSDLVRLYRNAYFTVYPSLYEGWGLPVAESLANGKFCLASNVASIPEVGGDLIEYLDPWDVPAWAARLHWYIEHPDDLLQKEQRIKKEYVPATWQNCATSILETALRDSEITNLLIAI